jgi:hypothetical protein
MTGGKRRGMEEFLRQQRELVQEGGDGQADGEAQSDGNAAPGGGITAAAVPTPYEATGEGALNEQEQADLATCEAALNNLRVAFWAAGKALQLVRDARLYRGTHGTFEAYVEERWEMSRPQAYRLIEAWPLADRLSPMGDNLNERQVRELLPLASRHGSDAAVTVYETVVAADGVNVTAALLHAAVATLPPDRFYQAEAIAQIRAYLARQPSQPSASPGRDPLAAFTAQTTRLLRGLRRVADGGTLQAAAHDNPAAVRSALAEIRSLLDEIEQGTA